MGCSGRERKIQSFVDLLLASASSSSSTCSSCSSCSSCSFLGMGEREGGEMGEIGREIEKCSQKQGL